MVTLKFNVARKTRKGSTVNNFSNLSTFPKYNFLNHITKKKRDKRPIWSSQFSSSPIQSQPKINIQKSSWHFHSGDKSVARFIDCLAIIFCLGLNWVARKLRGTKLDLLVLLLNEAQIQHRDKPNPGVFVLHRCCLISQIFLNWMHTISCITTTNNTRWWIECPITPLKHYLIYLQKMIFFCTNLLNHSSYKQKCQ